MSEIGGILVAVLFKCSGGFILIKVFSLNFCYIVYIIPLRKFDVLISLISFNKFRITSKVTTKNSNNNHTAYKIMASF